MASLRFDQRGHGDSEGRQEELTLATILNDIRVALTRVREATGARRRSLLAASFAGGVCAYYAAKRPDELDRLVMLNPLLLTMIATVHYYQGQLPGRQVDLYKVICEVFLSKRRQEQGQELELTPEQMQRVLEPVLATWDIRSGKSSLKAIYWSNSACRREVTKVESESMHVFHALVSFSLQRRSLCSLFSSL